MIDLLKLLGDPQRLRVINALQKGALSVTELREVLEVGQSNLSMRLGDLRKGGLVQDERMGQKIFYSLTIPPALETVIRQACAELPQAEADNKALQLVLDKRKQRTQAYFDDIIKRMGKDYAPGRSWKGLAGALLRIMKYDVVADLGAGEGFVSQLISPTAKQVIAIDNSPKMVKFGQELAVKHGLDNLEYRLGDIEAPPIDRNSVDLAVLSQALHHAQDPLRALNAARDILKPGGCLLVLDLLSHTHEQARELYQDKWLGFAPVGLERMLHDAGFENICTDIVDKEPKYPYFETLMAAAWKPA